MATQDVRLTATNPEDSSVVPVACNEKGELKLEEPLVVEGPPGEQGEPGPPGQDGDPFSGNFADDVTFGGNADFSGNILSTTWATSSLGYALENTAQGGSIGIQTSASASGSAFGINRAGIPTVIFTATGAATFAGGKAGFTAQGNLWCTTERGDTVMLEATVGGAGLWRAYTPTRLDRLKELLEENKTRPKPEESSRDEPENPQ